MSKQGNVQGVQVSGIEDALNEIINENAARELCPVMRTVDAIERQESADIAIKAKTVLEDTNYSATKIASLLRRNGYRIAKESIHRHRLRGTPTGCTCE